MQHALRITSQQWIDGLVSSRGHVASGGSLPINIVAPRAGVRRAGTDVRDAAATLENIIRDDGVRGAKAASAAGHFVIDGIADERVVNDDVIIRAIMGRKRCPIVDIAVAVTHVDASAVVFEVIGEDAMAISVNADTVRVGHVIAVVITIVAVTLADLPADAISDGVVAIGVAGGFVRNHFVLALATDKKIVFAQAGTGRKAQAAETPANGFRAVAAGTREVVKIIVMHPKAARDLAAGAGEIELFTERGFIAEFVVIDLHIITADIDVRDIVGGGNVKLDDIPANSAMTRAARDAEVSRMSELETLNRDVIRGAAERETFRAPDFL